MFVVGSYGQFEMLRCKNTTKTTNYTFIKIVLCIPYCEMK